MIGQVWLQPEWLPGGRLDKAWGHEGEAALLCEEVWGNHSPGGCQQGRGLGWGRGHCPRNIQKLVLAECFPSRGRQTKHEHRRAGRHAGLGGVYLAPVQDLLYLPLGGDHPRRGEQTGFQFAPTGGRGPRKFSRIATWGADEVKPLDISFTSSDVEITCGRAGTSKSYKWHLKNLGSLGSPLAQTSTPRSWCSGITLGWSPRTANLLQGSLSQPARRRCSALAGWILVVAL